MSPTLPSPTSIDITKTSMSPTLPSPTSEDIINTSMSSNPTIQTEQFTEVTGIYNQTDDSIANTDAGLSTDNGFYTSVSKLDTTTVLAVASTETESTDEATTIGRPM